MYEKFIALACVLAATVDAQCDPYYDVCDDYGLDSAAPVPMFPMDESAYVMMDVPSPASDHMTWVAFSVFNDDWNVSLEAWIATYDWANASFDQPNYEVFSGFVGYYTLPLFEEATAVCLYNEEAFTSAWCIGAGGLIVSSYTDAGTYYFDPAYWPADGEDINADDAASVMNQYFADGNFIADYAGGINGEFGYGFNVFETEFQFWHYNNGAGSDDYPQGDYQVIVSQYFADGSFIWFSDSVGIFNLSGASALASASMAAATVLYALL